MSPRVVTRFQRLRRSSTGKTEGNVKSQRHFRDIGLVRLNKGKSFLHAADAWRLEHPPESNHPVFALEPPQRQAGRAFDISSILEWSSDAVVAVDLNARIVFWNRAAEGLFGWTADEAIGQSVFLLYPDDRRAEGQQIVTDVVAGLSVGPIETVRRAKNGRLLDLEITYSPVLDERGEVAGVASTSRDIGPTRRRERELSDFVDNAAIGMHWVDPDGIVLYANRTHVNMLGYTHDEYVGHDVREFYEPPAVVDELLRRLGAGEILQGVQATMRHRDGSVRHVSIDSAALIRNGRFVSTRCFIRDVTQTKRLEEERDHLADIVASARDAIILRDLDGTVRSWNRGAEETFGYTAEEMLGADVSTILTPATNAQRREWQKALESGATLPPQPAQAVHRDGRILDLSVQLFPTRDPSGRLVGVGTITRDVTEQHRRAREKEAYSERLELMVADRTRELEAALARLGRTNEDLREFAEVAAHDLREPLRKIIQFGDLLRKELQNLQHPDAVHHLDRVVDAAARMGRLLDDLRAYATVGQRKSTVRPVALDDTLRDVLSDLDTRVAECEATVHVGPLPTIVADPSQMHHLFLNLIANALKFRRQGVTPIITVSGAETDGAMALIEVRDNGIGFDAPQTERLFRPFARLHSGFEGSGMGLAIVRRIVERYGGSITALGRPGQGATFLVRLPMEPVAEAPPA